MARRVPLQTSLGNVREHTRKVFEEFAAKFEIHFAWGIGASGDHKAGKALDLMAYELGGGVKNPGRIRPGWNKTVAEYAWANRKRLGINYVIYDQLIQSNNPDGYAYGKWHDYPGESHANHVHISLEENPPAYKPPSGGSASEASSVALSNADVRKIWNDKNIPNRNAPKDVAVNQATPAGILSNIEATQDVHNGLLLKLIKGQTALANAIERMVSEQPLAVQNAVKDALQDAIVQVDVDVKTPGSAE